MQRTRVESIDLVRAKVAGQQRHLAICIQTTLTEDPPTMHRPICVFRNVLAVKGKQQPWLWQDRPYFAEAAGELLVFRHTPTHCVGCGKKRIVYGYRDSRNRIFCLQCQVDDPVTAHPTDPLVFRHGNTEVALSCMPTAVWPDQFPVALFRDRIRKLLGGTKAPREEDGREWDALVKPSWFV